MSGRIAALGRRLRRVDGAAATPLTEGWTFRSVTADAVTRPEELPEGAGWLPCAVPTTAAAALQAGQAFSLDGAPRRFDADDWWWRVRFAGTADERAMLSFEGLATLAEVWLNGVQVLASENMFVAHEVDVVLAADNHLALRFRAVDGALRARRPRPRWRTPMIENQQLRWIRTTLLGRTPGWSPPAAVVGPWRPIQVLHRDPMRLDDVRVVGRLEQGNGIVEVSCAVVSGEPTPGTPGLVELVVTRQGTTHRAAMAMVGERWTAQVVIPNPDRWWPHTHGEPACYEVELSLRTPAGTQAFDAGVVGFRALALDTRDDGFGISIEGVPIFCRGACWTPLDPLTLVSPREALETALDQMVAAGLNMVRVGGTMVYESDDFYDLCDRKGVLVWQDFMFANMDYPDDEAFVTSLSHEVRQVLGRLRGRPSLAVLCGSSEGEQQAAMWGSARDNWSPRLFHEVIPGLIAETYKDGDDVPYWPSSAHGGAFPHQASAGSTSYYGVGAYLRPLVDARLSEVRFASECLAFANIPSARALPGGPAVRVHHPAWKTRTPRDLGAGWDFDDVRDHYLGLYYGADPAALRAVDHERYLALGRVVTGEVMADVFSEWRRARSTCRGGLIWFLRDLWTSAGWGIVQADGAPKAAYHFVRRALQPVAVFLTDEGVNGLALHAVNERPHPLEGTLELTAFQRGEVPVARASVGLTLAARAASELPVMALLDGFQDLTSAYRFGPPVCDVIVATLKASDGRPLAEGFHFPVGRGFTRDPDLGLTATLVGSEGDASATLVVRSRKFAQAVSIDVEGFVPSDDFFHLAPGGERTIQLRRLPTARTLRGTVQALNATTTALVASTPRP